MSNSPTYDLSQLKKFADGLERSLWTVAEGAGATGIVAGYQALPLPNIPLGYLPLVIILTAGVLAAIKSSIAQKFGNGTAATLPPALENTDSTVVETKIVVVPTPIPEVDYNPVEVGPSGPVIEGFDPES